MATQQQLLPAMLRKPPLPPGQHANNHGNQPPIFMQQRQPVQVQRQPQQQQPLVTGAGLRQQLSMGPASALTMSGPTANSAIEQLKKTADSMALQEHNASLKVKELVQRLETTEKSKAHLEEQLKQEEQKVKEMEARIQEDAKQFQDTLSRLEVVFISQAALEKDMQLAKSFLAQASDNEAALNNKWGDQDREVQELLNKFNELERVRASLEEQLATARANLADAEGRLNSAAAEGSNRDAAFCKLQGERDLLATKCEELNAQAKMLSDDLALMETRLEQATKQHSDLVSKHSDEITRISAKLQEAIAKLYSADAEVASLQAALAQEQKKLEEATLMITQLNRKQQELAAASGESEQKLSKQLAELQDAAMVAEAQQQQITLLKQAIDELHNQLQEVQLAKDAATSAQAEALQEMDKLHAARASKEAELLALIEEHKQQAEGLQAEKQALEERQAAELADLQRRLRDAETALNSASSTQSGREVQLKSQLDMANQNIQKISTMFAQNQAAMSKQAEEHRAAKAALEQELEALRTNSVVEMDKTRAALEEKHQLLEKQVLEEKQLLESNLAQHRVDVEKATSAAAALRKELIEAQASAAQQLISLKESHQEEVQRLCRDLDEAEQREAQTKTGFARDLADAQSLIVKLKKEVEAAVQERDAAELLAKTHAAELDKVAAAQKLAASRAESAEESVQGMVEMKSKHAEAISEIQALKEELDAERVASRHAASELLKTQKASAAKAEILEQDLEALNTKAAELEEAATAAKVAAAQAAAESAAAAEALAAEKEVRRSLAVELEAALAKAAAAEQEAAAVKAAASDKLAAMDAKVAAAKQFATATNAAAGAKGAEDAGWDNEAAAGKQAAAKRTRADGRGRAKAAAASQQVILQDDDSDEQEQQLLTQGRNKKALSAVAHGDSNKRSMQQVLGAEDDMEEDTNPRKKVQHNKAQPATGRPSAKAAPAASRRAAAGLNGDDLEDDEIMELITKPKASGKPAGWKEPIVKASGKQLPPSSKPSSKPAASGKQLPEPDLDPEVDWIMAGLTPLTKPSGAKPATAAKAAGQKHVRSDTQDNNGKEKKKTKASSQLQAQQIASSRVAAKQARTTGKPFPAMSDSDADEDNGGNIGMDGLALLHPTTQRKLTQQPAAAPDDDFGFGMLLDDHYSVQPSQSTQLREREAVSRGRSMGMGGDALVEVTLKKPVPKSGTANKMEPPAKVAVGNTNNAVRITKATPTASGLSLGGLTGLASHGPAVSSRPSAAPGKPGSRMNMMQSQPASSQMLPPPRRNVTQQAVDSKAVNSRKSASSRDVSSAANKVSGRAPAARGKFVLPPSPSPSARSIPGCNDFFDIFDM